MYKAIEELDKFNKEMLQDPFSGYTIRVYSEINFISYSKLMNLKPFTAKYDEKEVDVYDKKLNLTSPSIIRDLDLYSVDIQISFEHKTNSFRCAQVLDIFGDFILVDIWYFDESEFSIESFKDGIINFLSSEYKV